MTDPNISSVKADDPGKELSFITVIGSDQKGIVAWISTLLYEQEINIEDISLAPATASGDSVAGVSVIQDAKYRHKPMTNMREAL